MSKEDWQPVRQIGRVCNETWHRWKAAAEAEQISFTAWAEKAMNRAAKKTERAEKNASRKV